MRCGIDRIEGEEYLGATGLHLAIAYGNDEIASIIIEAKGLNINERALGTFFLPRDQERHSVLYWGRIEYLKTFGSLERETLIKIIILIGIARSAYLEPHLAILNRAS